MMLHVLVFAPNSTSQLWCFILCA